jgi:protein-disulfide isomerase
MRAFYDENKDKYKKDGKDSKPYEDIKDKIKSYLEKIAQRERRELYIADLKSKTPIMINLRKPDPPKLAVQFTDKDAFVGNSSALVTILEFTDFQCPFCVSSQETLKSIRTKYSDQVKIVTRHFPLSGHEGAKPLAIATLCANEQGKFEAYKAVVFGMRTVTNEDLILKAETLGGFNMEQFKQCLQSKKFDTQIQQDLADGQKYGVRGTPAFFVNGYPLMGAAPVEDFDELIQRALKETN